MGSVRCHSHILHGARCHAQTRVDVGFPKPAPRLPTTPTGVTEVSSANLGGQRELQKTQALPAGIETSHEPVSPTESLLAHFPCCAIVPKCHTLSRLISQQRTRLD